jgi:hypothetical protein
MEATYNGWTNRETWLINLWLTNDQGTEQDLRMLSQMDASITWRAERLESYVDDLRHGWTPALHGEPNMGWRPIGKDLHAGLFDDLLTHALTTIDWREIVANHEHDDDIN